MLAYDRSLIIKRSNVNNLFNNIDELSQFHLWLLSLFKLDIFLTGLLNGLSSRGDHYSSSDSSEVIAYFFTFILFNVGLLLLTSKSKLLFFSSKS